MNSMKEKCTASGSLPGPRRMEGNMLGNGKMGEDMGTALLESGPFNRTREFQRQRIQGST